jgi:hypothetical protein
MFSLKRESPSFQPLPTNMRHSVSQLLTKACFSAFILVSTQAANAVTTITYTTNSATHVPIPDLLNNPRPMQLSPVGTAMTVPSRNFIYTGLVGDYAPAGAWTPVSQSTALVGEQRFDYSFPNATSSSIGGTSGLATVRNWMSNLTLNFGSFYLNGSCSFCGSSNVVSVISSTLTGQAKYIDESPTSTTGNSVPGNQNQLTSGIYNILFGASNITGTLQYTAFTNVTFNPISQQSGGTIVLNVNANDPNPPTTAVPGPLPILGAGAAFGYSRRLRRRILSSSQQK